MKNKLLLLVSFLVAAIIAKAQNEIDTTVDLDVLTVPNSPAFTLLGVSPSEVDKPATITDFAFSIANASNNISKLPTNYAIEFLPFKLINPSKINSVKFFTDNGFANNLMQTFTISTGFSTNDGIDTTMQDYVRTRSGIGFKFSLIRGKIDSTFEGYRNALADARNALSEVHTVADSKMDSIRDNDSIYLQMMNEKQSIVKELIIIEKDSSMSSEIKMERKILFIKMLALTSKSMEDHFEKRKKIVIEEREGELYDRGQQLKKEIENIKFRRYGALLDFAGGMVLGFQNDDFQNSVVQQYAFWFNGGYTCIKGFNFLGVMRYTSAMNSQMDENGNKKDENIFDAGAKIEFETNDEKFSLSGEFIGRILTDTNVYRYTLNAAYQVGKNQALTFSIGKAFSGTAQYGGNLIAALNYARSFGSKRKVVPTESDH